MLEFELLCIGQALIDIFSFFLANNHLQSTDEYYTYETTEEQDDQLGRGKKSEERGGINNR